MKRIILTLLLFVFICQAYSQVEYYTNLANEYEREYTMNQNKAKHLDSEANKYLNYAKEYRRIADSCTRTDDTEKAAKFLKMAEQADENCQFCLKMAQDARILSLEKYKLYQNALSKMLRERKREQENLMRRSW